MSRTVYLPVDRLYPSDKAALWACDTVRRRKSLVSPGVGGGAALPPCTCWPPAWGLRLPVRAPPGGGGWQPALLGPTQLGAHGGGSRPSSAQNFVKLGEVNLFPFYLEMEFLFTKTKAKLL